MPSVPLLTKSISQPDSASSSGENPLPKLLQTPSGLAILEIQGTINIPEDIVTSESQGDAAPIDGTHDTTVGRLILPEYSADSGDSNNTAWMKRVYLYIGRNQRLTGEVKKLPKPLAVIRKVPNSPNDGDMEGSDAPPEQLEIVEIVRLKILFASRPEPVGG